MEFPAFYSKNKEETLNLVQITQNNESREIMVLIFILRDWQGCVNWNTVIFYKLPYGHHIVLAEQCDVHNGSLKIVLTVFQWKHNS